MSSFSVFLSRITALLLLSSIYNDVILAQKNVVKIPKILNESEPTILLSSCENNHMSALKGRGFNMIFVKHPTEPCVKVTGIIANQHFFSSESSVKLYEEALNLAQPHLPKNIIVFPSIPNEAEILRTFGEKYGYHVAVASREIEFMLAHKKRFKDFLIKSQLSNYAAKEYHSINEVKYPFILKIDLETSYASRSVFIIKNRKSFDSNIKKQHRNNYIMEELISSQYEACVYFVAYKGQILKGFECVHEDLGNSNKVSDGIAKKKYRPIDCEQLNSWNLVESGVTNIVKAANFSGMANIDFKWNSEGHPKFFEFNMPRFSLPFILRYAMNSTLTAMRVNSYLQAYNADMNRS